MNTVSPYGIEQLLKQYKTEDGIAVYNLTESIFIDATTISPGLFSDHFIREGNAWTTISYQYFTTIDLWWLIYACNRDLVDNPVTMPPNGTKIRIPTTQLVQLIFAAAANE